MQGPELASTIRPKSQPSPSQMEQWIFNAYSPNLKGNRSLCIHGSLDYQGLSDMHFPIQSNNKLCPMPIKVVAADGATVTSWSHAHQDKYQPITVRHFCQSGLDKNLASAEQGGRANYAKLDSGFTGINPSSVVLVSLSPLFSLESFWSGIQSLFVNACWFTVLWHSSN